MKEITDTERLDFLVENNGRVSKIVSLNGAIWQCRYTHGINPARTTRFEKTYRDAIDAAIKSQKEQL